MDTAATLQAIRERIDADHALPLRESASNIVFGKGNLAARIFFIGEAPGQKEDEAGIPFVGAAGRELDKLLNQIGLTLNDVYIANILKCRPPQNRNPNMAEICAHTPYLIDQLKAIRPEVIVTLGNFATRFVLNQLRPDGMASIPGISQVRGRFRRIKFDGTAFWVFPIYHPAAMLYNGGLRKVVEEDFRQLQTRLAGSAIRAKES